MYGGVLSIEESESNKITTDIGSKYLITNCEFENSVANVGGSLYISNAQYLTISNSTFLRNRAVNSSNSALSKLQGTGGGIYLGCDENENNCQYAIEGITRFEENRADIKGGAIHWE